MKFQKACGFTVFFVGLVSCSFISCVRVHVDTSILREAAPEAAPYPEQSLLVYKFNHVSRFDHPETEIKINEVQEILKYATLVARCGQDNNDLDCESKFLDMNNDFGCKIEFEGKDIKMRPAPGGEGDVIPTFDLQTLTGVAPSPDPNSEPDPLNCLADGIICSQNDLETVWGKVDPPNEGIKIVRDILWCQATKFNWAGCAQFPGSGGQAIAVIRHPQKVMELEGILWLHEFGHTKNLHHTPNVLSKDPNAVMRPGVKKSKTKLNRKECYSLRGDLP